MYQKSNLGVNEMSCFWGKWKSPNTGGTMPDTSVVAIPKKNVLFGCCCGKQ